MQNLYCYSPHSTASNEVVSELIQIRDTLYRQVQHQLEINYQLLQAYALGNVSNNKSSSQTGREYGSLSLDDKVIKEQAVQLEESRFGVKQPRQKPLKAMISKSDTKNIPKNYLKAINSFIKSSPYTKTVIRENNVSESNLRMNMKRLELRGNSIQTLRKMWGSENMNNKGRKCIRILSYIFMRKYSLSYIFNSKVKNYRTHLKYRKKLIEGIENPISFNHIKEY